jgi:hypothetical protein
VNWNGPDRRKDPSKKDTGARRRQADIDERVEEFRLIRDKILLLIGGVGLCIVTFAAIFIDVKSPELVLAAMTAFAGLLGAPTVLRFDERRRDGRHLVE